MHHLENSHLRGSILHGNAIRLEIEVALACRTKVRFTARNQAFDTSVTSNYLGVGCVFKVAVHDLLAEGQWAPEPLAHDGDVLVEPLVVDVLGWLKLAVGNVGESR